MGSLRSLTIQPKTRVRYDRAKDRFYAFLAMNALELPTKKHLLDDLLCEYLEYLWSSGEGRGLASDTLASLQDASPSIRGSIPGAWRLLKTWHTREIPNRAPPLPVRVMEALVGYFVFHNKPEMALSLLVGFYAMLRTGEVLAIRNRDVSVDASRPGNDKRRETYRSCGKCHHPSFGGCQKVKSVEAGYSPRSFTYSATPHVEKRI